MKQINNEWFFGRFAEAGYHNIAFSITKYGENNFYRVSMDVLLENQLHFIKKELITETQFEMKIYQELLDNMCTTLLQELKEYEYHQEMLNIAIKDEKSSDTKE